MTERRDGGDFALMVALAVAQPKKKWKKETYHRSERKLCQYWQGKGHYYYHIIPDNYYSR